MSSPTQDSLTRYQVQQDIYTVHSTPDALRIRAQRLPPQQDTLKSQQAKLERELVAGLGNGTLLLAAQFGKTLLLLILLPPYLVLYSTPKWLVMEAFPTLMEHIKNGGHFFSKGAAQFVALVLAPLQIAKLKLKNLQQKVNTLLKSSAEAFHSALARFGKQMEAVGQKIGQMVERLAAAPTKLFHAGVQVMRGLQKTVAEALNKGQKSLEKGWDQAASFANKQFQQLAQPVVRFARQLHKGAERLLAKTKERFIKLAKPIAEAIRTTYEKASEQVRRTYEAIAQPVIAFFAPKIEQVKEKLSLGLDAIKENFQALAERLAPLKEIPQAVLNFLAVPRQVREFGEKLGLSIVELYRSAKEMAARVPKVMKGLKNGIKEQLQRFKGWAQAKKHRAKAQAKALLERGKAMGRIGLKWIGWMLRLIGSLFAWLFHCVYVLFAWVAILIRYSLVQVRLYGQLTKESER